MTEQPFSRRLAIVLPVLAVLMFAAVGLCAWSIHEAQTAKCESRNATADLFHDVIILATVRPKGAPPLTDEQEKARVEFLTRTFARIDEIRC